MSFRMIRITVINQLAYCRQRRKCKDIKNMIPKPINLQSVGDDQSYSRTNTAKHMINKLESGIAGSREQRKSVLQLAIRVSCS